MYVLPISWSMLSGYNPSSIEQGSAHFCKSYHKLLDCLKCYTLDRTWVRVTLPLSGITISPTSLNKLSNTQENHIYTLINTPCKKKWIYVCRYSSSSKIIWSMHLLDKSVIKISKQKCHFVDLFCGINDSKVSH